MSGNGDRLQPPPSADALAGVVVRDLSGNDVRLGGLWSRHPVLLVFLRHYG